MIYFEKFLAQMLLPPGFFILLLLIAFIFSFKIKPARYIIGITIILLYSLSVPVLSNYLIKPLENSYEPNLNDLAKGDVYIVLGGGLIENKNNKTYSATLSPESLKRLINVYFLYKKYKKPIITTGGKSPIKKASHSEGYIMAKYLYDLGVNRNSIIIEAKSINTYENAKAVSEIIEKMVFKNPVLITSAYHMPRAIYSFKKFGVKTMPYPVNYLIESTPVTTFSFLPNINTLHNSVKALHEYLGIVYYRLFL
ncbi:MAG: YdcF family protein [Deferribacterota bacterium]|nr:YdcF family protein [Deferribacterota bacterium]